MSSLPNTRVIPRDLRARMERDGRLPFALMTSAEILHALSDRDWTVARDHGIRFVVPAHAFARIEVAHVR